MWDERARARAGTWRWLAVLGAATVALTFAATASAASAAVTGCAEVPAGYAITFSGGGGEVPVTEDDCKKGGYADFTDPAFKNQGRCVSSVVSKSK